MDDNRRQPTDEELVQMTTIQLRNLLEQRIISPEQHREFRSRRRRLQNRKYARRCAKKKQTEVAELASATKTESTAIKSLRQQLQRLNTSVCRIERQIHHLSDMQLTSADTSIFPPPSLRMLSAEGGELGYAYLLGGHHKESSTIIKLEAPEPIKMARQPNQPLPPASSFSNLSAGRNPGDVKTYSRFANSSPSPLLVSPAGGGGGFARGSRCLDMTGC